MELLRISVENLQRAKPYLNAELIRVRIIDGIQGSENHLILLDIVTTHRIGFLRHKNRVNIAISRARDSMLIFVSLSTLITNVRKEDRSYLTRVMTHYQDADLYDEITPTVSTYLPGTYESVEEVREDEVEEGELRDENVGWGSTEGTQGAEGGNTGWSTDTTTGGLQIGWTNEASTYEDSTVEPPTYEEQALSFAQPSNTAADTSPSWGGETSPDELIRDSTPPPHQDVNW